MTVPHDDGERRFVNNPFARALHPVASRSVWARLALIIVSIVGALVMMAALLLPLTFIPGLLVGGARAGRWGMVAAGALLVLLYGWLVFASVRRLLSRGDDSKAKP